MTLPRRRKPSRARPGNGPGRRPSADIVRLGREHLATHGAAALSLRAVARDLGVVSSAVYRYVANRDELLTLLLVDAYNELGDAVDAAVGRGPEGDFAGRFRARPGRPGVGVARACALWPAVRQPGARLPGARRADQAPGTRVIYSLVGILDAAYRAGELTAPRARAAVVPPALSADLEAIRAGLGLAVPDGLIANGVLVWTSLFGAVSFEVFGQYGADTFSAREELFEHHLAVLAGIAGFGRS